MLHEAHRMKAWAWHALGERIYFVRGLDLALWPEMRPQAHSTLYSLTLFDRGQHSPWNRGALEDLLAHGPQVPAYARPRSTFQQPRQRGEGLRRLSEAIARGDFVAMKEGWEPMRFPMPSIALPKPPPPEKGREQSPGWFEVRVVWDDSDQGLSGVVLVVDAGRGGTTMVETDAEGTARLEYVPDTCSVRSRVDGLTYHECAAFVGTGAESEAPRASTERRRPPRAVAVVERHRVRAGERFSEIASAAGLTWQKLAMFNFGTEDAKALRRYLANEVGCLGGPVKEKDSDYVFTRADEPGVILVPRFLQLNLLATGTHHVLRVMPIVPPKRKHRISL